MSNAVIFKDYLTKVNIPMAENKDEAGSVFFRTKQDLRSGEAVGAEGAFVSLAQPHLADGGGGLLLVQRGRTRGPAQPLHPFGHRARHCFDMPVRRVIQNENPGHHYTSLQLNRPGADRTGIDPA